MEKSKEKQKKSGGPYTGVEKIQRLEKVYEMHFEQGLSAVKIAKLLGVNRNTINADIRELFCETAKEFVTADKTAWWIEQLSTLRYQKSRLVEQLSKINDIKTSLHFEKLIFEIDYKLAQLAIKLMTTKSTSHLTRLKEVVE